MRRRPANEPEIRVMPNTVRLHRVLHAKPEKVYYKMSFTHFSTGAGPDIPG